MSQKKKDMNRPNWKWLDYMNEGRAEMGMEQILGKRLKMIIITMNKILCVEI